MKVICIDNIVFNKELTVGDVYDVIEELRVTYKIRGDSGVIGVFYKHRFEIVKEDKVVETEPNYTLGQMMDMLMANPNLQGILPTKNKPDYIIEYQKRNSCFSGVNQYYDFNFHNAKDRWFVREKPKLKKMNFIEMFKHFLKIDFMGEESCKYFGATSMLTGRPVENLLEVKEHEIYGLWTIEGVYEE